MVPNYFSFSQNFLYFRCIYENRLDVGSTTLKCVVFDETGRPAFQAYERHYSQIAEKAADMLRTAMEQLPGMNRAELCISGSAGMGLAEGPGDPLRTGGLCNPGDRNEKYLQMLTW